MAVTYKPKLSITFECTPLMNYPKASSFPAPYTLDKRWTFTSNSKSIIAEGNIRSDFINEMVWLLHYQRYSELYGCYQVEASRLSLLPDHQDTDAGVRLVVNKQLTWRDKIVSFLRNLRQRRFYVEIPGKAL
jgi:hypothetical protein